MCSRRCRVFTFGGTVTPFFAGDKARGPVRREWELEIVEAKVQSLQTIRNVEVPFLVIVAQQRFLANLPGSVQGSDVGKNVIERSFQFVNT